MSTIPRAVRARAGGIPRGRHRVRQSGMLPLRSAATATRSRTRASSPIPDRRRGAAHRRHRRGRHRQQRELRRGRDHCLDRPARRARHSAHRRRRERRGGARAGDRRARRRSLRLPAAQFGLLADQSRGGRRRRRHRGDPRAHRLSGADAQDASGHSADEPAGHSADDRHLGRSGLPARLHRRHRRAAPRRPTSSSRHAIGGCTRRCSTICARSPTPRSTPAPTS